MRAARMKSMAELIAVAEPEPQTTSLHVDSADVTRPKVGLASYGIVIFLSAFLLFQVQLIIGKYLLPLFGGAPAVWNTCMFFFQVLLLLGYGYAHKMSHENKPGAQGKVHGFLLISSLAILFVLWAMWGSPLTPSINWHPKPGDNPVWKILQLLAVSAALPFFLLSATAPLLQKWFSRNYSSESPYRLYALSNAGSLLGLLSYPFLIEPSFNLRHQAWLWSAGYAAFALLCAAIAWRPSGSTNVVPGLPGERTMNEAKAHAAPSAAHYLLWLALSTCSTTILLATTNLLCQGIAVIPLLWVAPLSLYLLSFILTFGKNNWYRRSVFWPLYFIALGLGTRPEFLGYIPIPLLWALGACGVCLFAVCMVCHGELVRSKPSAEHLTSFYLAIACGGALGGAFVVLVAPHLFTGFFEFQTAIIASGFLLLAGFFLEDRTGRGERRLWSVALLIALQFMLWHGIDLVPNSKSLERPYYALQLLIGIVAIVLLIRRDTKRNDRDSSSHSAWMPIAALLAIGVMASSIYGYEQMAATHVLFRERNFFGVKYVVKKFSGENEQVGLVSGDTVHGSQYTSLAKRNIPTTYYDTESGIGLLLSNYPRATQNAGHLRVGLIGMGAGTLAAYGQTGDLFRFYEIDPAVVALSSGPHPYFHYTQDSVASVETVLGDARLSLDIEAAQGQRQQFDVLVVDAFRGDSVPIHLLTVEAMNIYLKHLRNQDGVIAFHISSRFLDLRPVIVGLANRFQLENVQVNQGSNWILLSANPAMLRLPRLAEKARPIVLEKRPILWTDNYSNLYQLLHFRDR
jgi:hypothetical protein